LWQRLGHEVGFRCWYSRRKSVLSDKITVFGEESKGAGWYSSSEYLCTLAVFSLPLLSVLRRALGAPVGEATALVSAVAAVKIAVTP
jgi:hypothetical protein